MVKLWSIITGAKHFRVRYPGSELFTMRVSHRRARELVRQFGGWIFYDPHMLLDGDVPWPRVCQMCKCPRMVP